MRLSDKTILEIEYIRLPTPTLIKLHKLDDIYYLEVNRLRKTVVYKLTNDYIVSEKILSNVWCDYKFKHEISDTTLDRIQHLNLAESG